MAEETGELARLRIEAFTTPDYQGTAAQVFTAFVNPAEVTFSYEVEFDAAQGAGTTNSRMEFRRLKPGDLSLALFLDATGANGRALDVTAKVDEFMRVTGYSGDIHRPHYLKVQWGRLPERRCVLKAASIAYKLFSAAGVPLRAVITATFSDNADDRTRAATTGDASSDLTHARVVKAGDTLPGLCARIYGDPRYYLAVAHANGLDDFRRLRPGTRILFPPLEK